MTPLLPAAARRRFLLAALAAAAWPAQAGALPPGVRVLRDLAYGGDPAQRFDVYLPPQPQQHAPLIFMVHGGGWRHGDKAMARVVANKVARWVPRGIVFVSIDYPLLPVPPVDQARQVARALAAVQQRAADWGADPARVVVMGHSAGAHLLALLAAAPELAGPAPLRPWLGSVLLDSAAYDLPRRMGERHPRLFDQAFGDDPAAWRAASPLHRLHAAMPPLLAVYSSTRSPSPAQAEAFAAKARAMGGRAALLPVALSHAQINEQLGQPGAYTEAVEDFLVTLDDALATRLRPR